ncbi:MAG: site-specific integrase, partial [Cyclobacteriaceae bacterium]
MTAHIFAKKDYVRPDGSVPLYLRLIINRKVYPPINLKRRVTLSYWDEGLRLVTDDHPNARKINHLLKRTQAQADDILLDHEITGRTITWDTFRMEFAGLSAYNYFDLVADYLEKHKSEYSDSYKDKVRFVTQKLASFAPSLEVHQIDYDWLLRYRDWMAGTRKNNKNTIHSNMRILRRVLKHGIKKKLLKLNPFDDFTLEKVKTERASLTLSELNLYLDLLNHELPFYLRKTLCWFLLAVYTGRRYQDIQDFYNWRFKADHVIITQMKRVRGRQERKEIVLFLNNKIRGIAEDIRSNDYQPLSNTMANKFLKELTG